VDQPGDEPDPADGAGDEQAAAGDTADREESTTEEREPETLPGHVEAVIDAGTGRVRLLDGEFGVLAEADAGEAFDAVADAETVPAAVVLDGELSQRVLDVAAQRGVGQVVAAGTGDFVKQPTGVRVRTAAEF
jgi:hypothetical protein